MYLQFYLHKFSKQEHHTALELFLQCITTLIHHTAFNDGSAQPDKSPALPSSEPNEYEAWEETGLILSLFSWHSLH